jgi:hypothetical protein
MIFKRWALSCKTAGRCIEFPPWLEAAGAISAIVFPDVSTGSGDDVSQPLRRFTWRGAELMSRAIFSAFFVLWSSTAFAITEIPVRNDRDGAGPSHIFHLKDNQVVVIDPLESKLSVFRICQDGACNNQSAAAVELTRTFPSGARFRRIVRQSDQVTLISEDEKQILVVPRDIAKWPASFGLSQYRSSDRNLAPPKVKRNTSYRVTFPRIKGYRAQTIRTIGPTYLASARELERDARGRRYFLWKELYFSDSTPFDARQREIQVRVYIGRFERNGTLSGLVTIPLARMNRLGFDYVTVLPSGAVLLLASLDKGNFQITERAISKPDKATVKAFQFKRSVKKWPFPPDEQELRTLTSPSDNLVLNSEGEDTLVTSGPVKGIKCIKCSLSRVDMRSTMNAYRDHAWTPQDRNLRNPCDTQIVPGWPIDCPKKDRFVRPPQFVRKPYGSPQIGIPYDWGGTDTIDGFDRKTADGYVAGNIGGTFWSDDNRRVTTGVDCSGLLANVWKLGRHISTSELETVSVPLRDFVDMRLGDIFLLAGKHVMLYREQVSEDGASLAIRVIEAGTRCGSVCGSVYEVDALHNFVLRRRKN